MTGLKPKTTSNSKPKDWWVYMVHTAEGQLYTGIATDIDRRFHEHLRKFIEKKGVGAKYFLSHEPKKVVYSEMFDNRSDATKREMDIKKISRSKQCSLVGMAFQTDNV